MPRKSKKKSQQNPATVEVDVSEVYGLEKPLPVKDGERPDWTRHHELILYYTSLYIKKHLTFPSMAKLAELTGLNRETVSKHLRTYDQERRKKKYQVVLEQVVAKLAKDFQERGDARNAELLLKYVGNWRDPYSIEHSGQVDFRTAKERVNESSDDTNRVRNFVTYLNVQNDRRQLIGQN